MKTSFTAATAFVVGVLAIPTTLQRRVNPIYGSGNPVIDSVCPAPTPPSLVGLFPFANLLGSIISPILHGLIGDEAVEELDNIAGVLCISTLLDPSICRDALGAIRDFVDDTTPLGQSKKFGCLLDFLCVANGNTGTAGTCNLLLQSADCIANRIIGVEDLECE